MTSLSMLLLLLLLVVNNNNDSMNIKTYNELVGWLVFIFKRRMNKNAHLQAFGY